MYLVGMFEFSMFTLLGGAHCKSTVEAKCLFRRVDHPVFPCAPFGAGSRYLSVVCYALLVGHFLSCEVLQHVDSVGAVWLLIFAEPVIRNHSGRCGTMDD